MKRKIIVIMVAVGLFVMANAASTSVSAVDIATTQQGYSEDSYTDGVSMYDGTNLLGNYTVIHPADPEAINFYPANLSQAGSWTDNSGYDTWQWDAGGGTGEDFQWNSNPTQADNIGDMTYFIAQTSQGGTNYTYCTNSSIEDDTSLPASSTDNDGRLEPIKTPSSHTVGPEWINVTIPMPDFTDGAGGMGTYDNLKSYAVFIDGTGYDGKTYLNNSMLKGSYDTDSTTYDQPLNAYTPRTDPGSVLTGEHYYNTSFDTTLTPDGTYNITLRMNFGTGAYSGGYGGGLGSYTTWGASGSYGAINTPTAEEFPTVIVPVIATMSIFLAAIYYRRKREE